MKTKHCQTNMVSVIVIAQGGTQTHHREGLWMTTRKNRSGKAPNWPWRASAEVTKVFRDCERKFVSQLRKNSGGEVTMISKRAPVVGPGDF